MPFAHPQSHSIALACPYACSCNAARRTPASDLCFACRSAGLIKLTSARPRAWNSSFPGLEVLKGNEIARLCPYTHPHQISLRHQANTPVPDLPFTLHGTKPGAPSTPSLPILCTPNPVMYALMPVCSNHWSHSLDSGSFT